MPIIKVKLGKNVTIWHPELVNLYECELKDGCSIGAFTEIGKGVVIGKDTSIGAHCFIPEGVVIGDRCFIGPGVRFANDKFPPTRRRTGKWESCKTIVEDGAVIGLGCAVGPAVVVGAGCLVGMHSCITNDILPGYLAKGNPARNIKPLDWSSDKDMDR